MVFLRVSRKGMTDGDCAARDEVKFGIGETEWTTDGIACRAEVNLDIVWGAKGDAAGCFGTYRRACLDAHAFGIEGEIAPVGGGGDRAT